MVMTAMEPMRLAAEEWQVDEQFEPLTNEKVIGVNNLLNIAWLARGLALAAPVARVVAPEGAGTGFLIGSDLLLTNNHVLPVDSVADQSTVEFNYQLNWAGQLEPVKRCTLDSSHFRTSQELDYTIVRVRESPGDLYGYVDLLDHGSAAVNDFVTIIQHPMGGPKQICLTDNKVAALFGNVVQYSTDTEPGSSGSPVFSQAWQIVGLHHAGGELAGPDGSKYFTNEAIVIALVLRDAAAFLGLPDPIYNLAFNELRATLAKLIDQADPPPDPSAAALDLLRTQPRVAAALDQWAELNGTPDQSVVEAVAGAGVAVGAALRQWARSSGHESITAASPSTPPPTADLIRLIARFNGSNDAPSDVYAAVLAGVNADATLVAGVVSQVARDSAVIAPAHAFLVGVTVGGKAYDGPSGGSPGQT